jgi:glycosyltransferase involved in cell wall biosynthesis
MKILFICNKSPWPAKEGGPIAMNNIIEGMIALGHQVKVLAAVTNKYSISLDDVPEEYRKKTGLELAFIDLSIKPVAAFYNLFTSKSYHVQRFISKTFEKKLIAVLQRETFDIVQIEMLYMSPYLNVVRKYSDAKVVLRAHNIEHLIWKRVAIEETVFLKKLYLRHLASTLEKYEKNILNKYDGIIPITKKDAIFFSAETSIPVEAVSFGVDFDKIPYNENTNPEHALFHIGSMNWIPNIEGIKWFLKEVWPEVSEQLPQLKLYLAGREMPEWLKNTGLHNVIIAGEVPDAYKFMESKTVSVAPLFSGSGIRIKIIESMAMGKAVIATSIGAEGINYTHGENIYIADTKKEFVKAVKKLYKNPELAHSLGQKARLLVKKEHNIKETSKQLERFYQSLKAANART